MIDAKCSDLITHDYVRRYDRGASDSNDYFDCNDIPVAGLWLSPTVVYSADLLAEKVAWHNPLCSVRLGSDLDRKPRTGYFE